MKMVQSDFLLYLNRKIFKITGIKIDVIIPNQTNFQAKSLSFFAKKIHAIAVPNIPKNRGSKIHRYFSFIKNISVISFINGDVLDD